MQEFCYVDKTQCDIFHIITYLDDWSPTIQRIVWSFIYLDWLIQIGIFTRISFSFSFYLLCIRFNVQFLHRLAFLATKSTSSVMLKAFGSYNCDTYCYAVTDKTKKTRYSPSRELSNTKFNEWYLCWLASEAVGSRRCVLSLILSKVFIQLHLSPTATIWENSVITSSKM